MGMMVVIVRLWETGSSYMCTLLAWILGSVMLLAGHELRSRWAVTSVQVWVLRAAENLHTLWDA
jgi:hypothetical protein